MGKTSKIKSKRGDSHSYFERNRNLLKSKRSQITLFIILALAILAIVLVIFYPKLKEVFIPPAPGSMIPKSCVESAVKNGLNETLMRGGSIEPELYFMYNNYSLQYLCYTSEWYKTCVNQEPLLRQHIEAEIQNYFGSKIDSCVDSMLQSFSARGYDVRTSGSKKGIVSIEPDRIRVAFDMNVTLSRNEVTERILSDRFDMSFKSNAYDLIMISTSILNYEARYGDTVPEVYMSYYPNLKVEKIKQSDGSKVYKLTDRNTGEVFQFATRSKAWPPGYGETIAF